MIQEIPVQPVPQWISAANTPLGEIPIRDVLTRSVYYAACAFDGDPVKFLCGNFHSFIYVDYGVEHDHHIKELDGFRGYRLAAFREVTERELTPNDWTPIYPRASDGNPKDRREWCMPPFSVWSIHERTEEYGTEHGPTRFSLLYISGDGVATFQALYHGNRAAPAVVAVIQPGTSFGGNWTDFEKPEGFFARSVLGNPSGAPEYLLFGGWGDGEYYRRPCWPRYGQLVRWLHKGLRLWKQSSEPCRPGE